MDFALPVSPTPTRPHREGPGGQMALIFIVEDSRYAVPLADVLEVTPAAALMSPSDRPSGLIGFLDLRGDVIAVFSARELMALPGRELRLSDRFVVVRSDDRHAAIVVDRVEGVEEIEAMAPTTVADPAPKDGLTWRRRTGAEAGESLVAMIELDRLLDPLALGPTEGAA